MNSLDAHVHLRSTTWKSVSTLLGTTLFCCLISAFSASAQTDESTEEDVFVLDTFTILGSAITRFEADAPQPVSSLDMEDIEVDGFVSPGEIFSELVYTGEPEFSEVSDGPNDARGDVTSINLRGAGPGQSLILLNGRRLAPHPLNQTVGQTPSVLVNANVIPSGLIDRVDVLRDGASAIYGTDASAGVVNTVLDKNLLGNTLRLRYGQEENGDFTEQMYQYTLGYDFNEGKSNISLFISHFERDPIFGTDRSYASPGDKRPLVDEKWRDDVSIINVSSGSVYSNLETDLPGSRDALFQNGDRITDSTGRFHLNAPGLGGTTATLADGTNIDNGTLPRAERYDFTPFRTLTSEVERQNVFVLINHEMNENINFFAEFGYYTSETYQERAPVVIGTSDALVIPASNYYNPFGPVTFADGRTNPNRLSGITLENGDPLPDEGIGIQLDGWRAQDIGPRLVWVESDSYLFTAGFSGKVFNDWYWETGLRINTNKATDTSGNRITKSGLTAALANDTPAALNVFSGPDVNDPANFQDMIVEVSRTAKTELISYDLRANNPSLFELFQNPVGLAVGFEAREETYEDDRDPRIDGTIRFDDTFQGASDIIGVSPTNDSESDRTVAGVYAEMLVPIFGKANRVPGLHRLEAQLALRWEDYSDFGDVTKPKAALFWYLNPDILLRGSYAEGFTAPNLSLLTDPIQRFNTGVEDSYRLQWDPDNAENDGSNQLADLRGGNSGLGPEESETITYGLVWNVSAVEGLLFTLDYWEISISDRIGTLGTADIIDIDAEVLAGLSANPGSYSPGQVVTGDPRVERGPLDAETIALATSQGFAPAGPITRVINPFVNEASREIAGWDFAFQYQTPEYSFGRFRVGSELSYTDKYEDQEQAGGRVNDLLQDEIRPQIRAKFSLNWRKNAWSAGMTTNYIGETYDNDVDATDGEEWVIEEYWRTSLRLGYEFEEGMFEGMKLTFGVRNLFDEEPPLNPDESIGYEASLHSNRERYYYLDLRYSF
jgi:iron complex outermembrane receptor protein